MELIFFVLILLWFRRKPRNESEEIEKGLLATILLVAAIATIASPSSAQRPPEKIDP